MDKAETLKTLSTLKAAFPASYKDLTPGDAEAMAALWQKMFADDGYNRVSAAVAAYIATSTKPFPPSIGQLKEALFSLTQDGLTAQEAWALASKAAAGSLPWEKLPEEVQKAIGSKSVLRDWGMIETDTFNTVIYSNFIKSFGIIQQRKRNDAALPAAVKNLLGSVSESLRLGD